MSQYPLIWAVASDSTTEPDQGEVTVSQYPLIWAVASDGSRGRGGRRWIRSQYPLIWAVASDDIVEGEYTVITESQYPLIWAVASDGTELVNNFGFGVSIPSHLGSSFGHRTHYSTEGLYQVSIPSHLGSSFGPSVQ